jgi:diacylglycerol kinase
MISPRKFKFSLKYAWNGLRYLYSSQNNVRIHLLVTIFVVVCGILLRISLIEWGVIILAIGLVWAVEALNTVFERLFDLLDENYNPIIKIGKDVSAAAVLISAIISAIIGILILAPPFIDLLIKWSNY